MTSRISRLPIRNAHANASAAASMPTLKERAEAVARIAESHANDVDRDSRFPVEAIDAAREHRLLGMQVPVALGGEGATAADIVDVCFVLGRACSSTAMIFAMHQVKVACLVRHSRGNAWQEEFQRRIVAEQMLLASSTTEGNGGGNLRASEAAIQPRGARIALTRAAACISYGEHADAIVTTARRSETSPASDQVLVAFDRDDYALERTNSWDTLGMRGTCSVGYMLRAEGHPDQVLPEPYERIHGQTMMPVAHLYWSAAWTGIAAGAVQRARLFVRAAARGANGKMPPAAAHLTRARLSLETLRARVQSGVAMFERRATEPIALAAIDVQTALTFLKVEASELALQTVMSAMRACGLSGYRNDTDFSMGRYLRDILSSPIMINNDRILTSAEPNVLMSEISPLLSD
jgi:acyl-CoA dehydrogenase